MARTTELAISWLHLTDLHWGCPGKDQLWAGVKGALWEDLLQAAEILGPPDLVLCTGDVAFSGQKEEYQGVGGFLDELAQRLGRAEPPPLIAVPGNHDVAQPKSGKDRALRWLRFYDDPFHTEAREDFWRQAEPNPDREPVRELFRQYAAFEDERVLRSLDRAGATIRRGLLPGDLCASLDLGGFRLGLVGLNSAWRQYTKGDFQGRVTADPRQLNAVVDDDLTGFRDRHHLTLLLQHHPPSWLANRQEWESLVVQPFGLVLLGHLHAHDSEASQKESDRARCRLQARSLFGVKHYGKADEQRAFGYAWGKAELRTEQRDGKERWCVQLHTWARKLTDKPRWRFVHPEEADYTETKGMRWPLLDAGSAAPSPAAPAPAAAGPAPGAAAAGSAPGAAAAQPGEPAGRAPAVDGASPAAPEPQCRQLKLVDNSSVGHGHVAEPNDIRTSGTT